MIGDFFFTKEGATDLLVDFELGGLLRWAWGNARCFCSYSSISPAPSGLEAGAMVGREHPVSSVALKPALGLCLQWGLAGGGVGRGGLLEASRIKIRGQTESPG